MRRREFINLVGGSLAAAALGVRAQKPPMPTIGFVRSSSIDSVANLVAAFRDGLKETGYVDGRNVAIEFRSADDHVERLPSIVADLIRRQVSVLVVNTAAARVTKGATTSVPIVFATGYDPVKDMLVASYNRPGGNLTGISFFNSSLGAKKLELIRYLVPKDSAIAVLENPSSPSSVEERIDAVSAAQALGQRAVVLGASTEDDFDAAFAKLVQERAAALVVTGDALFLSRRKRLVATAARRAVPTIYSEKLIVDAGGLMSYGASIADAYRQVGVYTGRILKGEKPADMPVLQSSKFDFVINVTTAKAMGWTIPQSLLVRADEVIQ